MARLLPRKSLFLCSLVAVLGLLLSACGDAPDQTAEPTSTPGATDAAEETTEPMETVKVTLAHTPSLLNLPIYVADESGAFAEQGIEVEFVLVGGGAEIVAALLSDSVNFALKSLDSVATLQEQGQMTSSVVGSMSQSTQSLVMSTELEDELTPGDLSGLKGKKLGITQPGSGTDRGLRALLIAGGLDPEVDVALVSTRGVSESLPALASGSIDGFFMPEPAPATAIQQGIGYRFVDLRESGPPEIRVLAMTGVLAKDDYIEANTDVVERFVRAVVQAESALAADPALAIPAVHEHISAEMDADLIAAIMETDYPFYIPELSEESVQTLLQSLEDSDAIPDASAITYEDMVATQFQDIWDEYEG